MKVYLTVHPDAVTQAEVFEHIAAPLVEHRLGWKGLSVVHTHAAADSVVTLTPRHVMRTLFPEFQDQRLSVCDMQTREVWLNEDRWRRVLPDASHLPLPAYRAYMVQHELGHALGHGHDQHKGTPGEPAPVMIQQTLGIGTYSPNPFPTSTEMANQKKSRNFRRPMK